MTRQLNYSKIIVATLLVGLGFYLVSNVNHFISIPYIGYFSLLIFGTIAYCLVFGFKAYEKSFIKNQFNSGRILSSISSSPSFSLLF